MTEPTPDAAQVTFAAAIVFDDELYLRALRDPHAAAAEYGLTLTEEQAGRIRTMQPEEIEKLRDTMRANHGWFPEWGHTGFW